MYCPCRAGFFTGAAADALRMVGVLCRIDVHFADLGARSAASTRMLVDPVAKYGYGIEYGVNCSQGAYVLAKWPVNEDG